MACFAEYFIVFFFFLVCSWFLFYRQSGAEQAPESTGIPAHVHVSAGPSRLESSGGYCGNGPGSPGAFLCVFLPFCALISFVFVPVFFVGFVCLSLVGLLACLVRSSVRFGGCIPVRLSAYVIGFLVVYFVGACFFVLIAIIFVVSGYESYFFLLVVLPKYASCRPVWRTKTTWCCILCIKY